MNTAALGFGRWALATRTVAAALLVSLAVTGTSWLSGGHRADVVARAPKWSEVRRRSEDQPLDQLDVLVVDEDSGKRPST